MPIFVKDYVWRQTDNTVIMTVPLRDTHPSKCDVFTSENYIKVHFPPYLCEIFLHAAVVDAESRCTLGDGSAVFSLKKAQAEEWPRLSTELSREGQREVREAALSQAHEAAKTRRTHIMEQQAKLERETVQEQIRINELERMKIEANKTALTREALCDLTTWRQESSGAPRESTSAVSPQKTAGSKPVTKFPPPKPKPVAKKSVPLPPPRDLGEIQVAFTPRKFPTPKRESTSSEETEWLQKQAEARKVAGFCAEDLRPEEMDPEWLKDKGDSFLRAGNALGAEAAYSHAISLGCRLPALFCNRAAAHLALGNLHKVVEDCSTGLELLVPATPSNCRSRARCHARRGAALCRLDSPLLGIPDLKAALALCPDDQKLRDDLSRAEKMLEQEELGQ